MRLIAVVVVIDVVVVVIVMVVIIIIIWGKRGRERARGEFQADSSLSMEPSLGLGPMTLRS